MKYTEPVVNTALSGNVSTYSTCNSYYSCTSGTFTCALGGLWFTCSDTFYCKNYN